MAGDDPGPSLWARRLGYGGLIPFLGLTAALWVARPGAAQPLPALVWGVTPSLLGWVALLLDPAAGLALITLLLWVCYAVDRALYPRYQMQAWLPMRLWLTLTASSSCLAAVVALQRCNEFVN